MGVFQETKLTEGIYRRRSAGYKVVATPAPSRHRGGVALFYRDSSAFAAEAIRQFRENIVACQMATGDRWWYIVGCYLAPGDDTTIWDAEAEAAMAERPRGAELIVAGDFNVDLENTGGRGRYEEITAAVATAFLEDLAGNLLLQRQVWYKYQRMWVVLRQGRVVRSRKD